MAYVCWICVQQFRTAQCLLRHERKEDHQLLLIKQALGKERGRNHKRRQAQRRELAGFCIETEKSLQDRHPEISFCLCNLNWIVGRCPQNCAKTKHTEKSLRNRILKLLQEKQKYETLKHERRECLGLGLQFSGNREKYQVEIKSKKFKTDGLLTTLVKYIQYQHFLLFGVTENTRRRRSPLASSSDRQENALALPTVNYFLPTRIKKLSNQAESNLKRLFPDASTKKKCHLSPLVHSSIRQQQQHTKNYMSRYIPTMGKLGNYVTIEQSRLRFVNNRR